MHCLFLFFFYVTILLLFPVSQQDKWTNLQYFPRLICPLHKLSMGWDWELACQQPSVGSTVVLKKKECRSHSSLELLCKCAFTFLQDWIRKSIFDSAFLSTFAWLKWSHYIFFNWRIGGTLRIDERKNFWHELKTKTGRRKKNISAVKILKYKSRKS
jgi:hypothetical protein